MRRARSFIIYRSFLLEYENNKHFITVSTDVCFNALGCTVKKWYTPSVVHAKPNVPL